MLRNGSIIAIVLIVISFMAFRVLWRGSSYENFDQEKWKLQKNERWKMASGLLENKLLIGKDSSQIKALLGEPDNRTDSISQWVYDMGGGVQGLGFHFDYLKVRYKDGVVADVVHYKAWD